MRRATFNLGLKVCDSADDNTIFACGETLDEVAKCIKNYMKIAMNWVKLNGMVANQEKFQLIFFGIKEDHGLSIEINGDVMKMSDTVKLVGVIIHSFHFIHFNLFMQGKVCSYRS